jgi:hypothetical protein
MNSLNVRRITLIEVQLLGLCFLCEKQFLWEVLLRTEKRYSGIYQKLNLFQGSSVTFWNWKSETVQG